MSMHQMTVRFNSLVLGINPRPLGFQDRDEFRLSMRQLREEIEEIEAAYESGDMVKLVDGLVDLDYFHKGILHKHGIIPEVYLQLFQAVHEANMEKKQGVNPNRTGFGGKADAVKPAEWIPPEDRIMKILKEQLGYED